MRSITVDGIYGRNTREHGFNFFSIKPDYYYTPEDPNEVDGYLDEEDVYWGSPYAPISQDRGDIDMEAWMSEGIVRGKKDFF